MDPAKPCAELAATVAHEINTPLQFAADGVHYARESMVALERWIPILLRLVEARPEDMAALSAEARAMYEEADLAYVRANAPVALESALDGLRQIAEVVAKIKDRAIAR